MKNINDDTPALKSLFGTDHKVVVELSDAQAHAIGHKYPNRPQSESPSSIKSFLGCPGGWFAERYVLPRTPSTYPAVVGTFVHRILECHYNGPEDTWTDANLKDTFRKSWRELCGDDPLLMIPKDLKDEFDALDDEGKGWFRGGFYNKSRDALANLSLFDPEPENMNIHVNEIRGRIESNGIVINGKIDRIQLDEDGNEIIEDWKTGRDPDESEALEVTSKSFIPVGIYALMRDKPAADAGREVSAVELLFLKSGNCYSIKANEKMVTTAKTLVNSTTLAMKEVQDRKVLPLVPSSDNCVFCPLKKFCPTKRGNSDSTFDEALASAKEALTSDKK